MREHSLGAESDLRPSLTDAQTARICETGRPEKLVKGAVLYRQGEPAGHVFLLNEGRAKASSLNAHGDETLMNYNWFGFLERPISPVLILAGFATIAAGVFKAMRKDFQKAESGVSAESCSHS